jgi:hypothetical protein
VPLDATNWGASDSCEQHLPVEAFAPNPCLHQLNNIQYQCNQLHIVSNYMNCSLPHGLQFLMKYQYDWLHIVSNLLVLPVNIWSKFLMKPIILKNISETCENSPWKK